MGKILRSIIDLAEKGEVVISAHGYDELAADNLFVRDILLGLNSSELLEEYPDYSKGPCVLVLQGDKENNVVWGIAKDTEKPAVLITAYRPDPEKWKNDFRSRKK